MTGPLRKPRPARKIGQDQKHPSPTAATQPTTKAPANAVTIIEEDDEEDQKTYRIDPRSADTALVNNQDPNEKLGVFLMRHCKIARRDPRKTKILYNGKEVKATDTFRSLGMTSGDSFDIVDVDEAEGEDDEDRGGVKKAGDRVDDDEEEVVEVIRKETNLADARAQRAARRNRMRGNSEEIIETLASTRKKRKLREKSVTIARDQEAGGVQLGEASADEEKSKSQEDRTAASSTQHPTSSELPAEAAQGRRWNRLKRRTAIVIREEEEEEEEEEDEMSKNTAARTYMLASTALTDDNPSQQEEGQVIVCEDDDKDMGNSNTVIQSLETVMISSGRTIPETPLCSSGEITDISAAQATHEEPATNATTNRKAVSAGEGGFVTVKIVDNNQNTLFESKIAMSGLEDDDENQGVGYVTIDYKGSHKRYKLF